MNRKVINTTSAPAPIGPYSQGIKVDNLLFISGQLAIEPASGEISATDIKSQTRQVMENIKAILLYVGASTENIVKTTVFLKNMNDFSAMNEVYQEYFQKNAPARSCVAVTKLPKDALIEVESIAILN